MFALIGLGLPVPANAAKPPPGGTGGGSGLNVKIQGFDKISKSWTAGNTAGYAELEKIPFRISLQNGSTTTLVDSIETVYDHERSGVAGIEDLFDFVLCKGSLTKTWTPTAPGANGPCTTILVYPQGTVPPGTDPYITFDGFRDGSGGTEVGVYTWHRLSIPAGQTWTLTWGAKLALGSHLYNGSALHMQIGAASVGGSTVSFGSKDVPIPVNAILATETDKKINGSDGPVPVSLGDRVRITILAKAFGPSSGTQTLKVVDTLPPCLTFDGDDATVAGTPTVTGNTVTYTFSNVKNGTSVLAASSRGRPRSPPEPTASTSPRPTRRPQAFPTRRTPSWSPLRASRTS